MAKHHDIDHIFDINSETPYPGKVEKFLEQAIPASYRDIAREEIDKKMSFVKNGENGISILFNLQNAEITKAKFDEKLFRAAFKTMQTEKAKDVHKNLFERNNLK